MAPTVVVQSWPDHSPVGIFQNRHTSAEAWISWVGLSGKKIVTAPMLCQMLAFEYLLRVKAPKVITSEATVFDSGDQAFMVFFWYVMSTVTSMSGTP